jgi:hypothetical protein
VGLDLGQLDRRVGHQLVEVLHDHGLGQHGQLLEGPVDAAGMEPSVEGRMGVGVLAHLPQRACLVSMQLLGGPAVVPAKDVPAA